MTKIGPSLSVEYRANEFTDQKTWLAATGIYDKDTVAIPGTSRVSENSKRCVPTTIGTGCAEWPTDSLGPPRGVTAPISIMFRIRTFFVSSTKGLQVLTGPVTTCSGCLGVICRKTIKTA